MVEISLDEEGFFILREQSVQRLKTLKMLGPRRCVGVGAREVC